MLETWIYWCQKQLADLSERLQKQGYYPAKIELLNQACPEFQQRYHIFVAELNEIMDAMAANPGGYHHFEEFTSVKMELLEFTNLNREHYLELHLAKTA